jgi:hypothetical protein
MSGIRLGDLAGYNSSDARSPGGSTLEDVMSESQSSQALLMVFPVATEEEIMETGAKPFPTGVCGTVNGDIIVVDNEYRVGRCFDDKGQIKFTFGKGVLKSPWNVFCTGSGKIAVSDPGAGDIKVFSRKGKFLTRSDWGMHLVEPYGLDLNIKTGEIIVTDTATHCIYEHSPSGMVKHLYKLENCIPDRNFRNPVYVAYDVTTEGVVVSDCEAHQIYCLTKNEEVIMIIIIIVVVVDNSFRKVHNLRFTKLLLMYLYIGLREVI